MEHMILRTTQWLLLKQVISHTGYKYDMKSKKLQTIQHVTKTVYVKRAHPKANLDHPKYKVFQWLLDHAVIKKL